MKGMILAAGLGMRLRPLTDIIPKPLIPVNGRPLIAHTLSFLKKYGVTDVIINLHHHADKVRKALGDGGTYGVTITYMHEDALLGTGGGLKNAEQYLSDGTFFLINSDIIADVNLRDVLSFHKRKGAVATMVLREDPDAESYGPVTIDRGGRVRQFLHAPHIVHDDSLRTYMFTGIHVLEPAVFRHLPTETFSSITEVMYPSLLLHGEPWYGYVLHGYWIDLGTQDRYNKAINDIEAGRVKTFFDHTIGSRV